jgi:hypothetical protein
MADGVELMTDDAKHITGVGVQDVLRFMETGRLESDRELPVGAVERAVEVL